MGEMKTKVQAITQNTVVPLALVISLLGSAISYGQFQEKITTVRKELDEVKADRAARITATERRLQRIEFMQYRIAIKMNVKVKDLYGEGE